ncbi:CDP-alcohol phosphatidyltransferase family protein [Sporichthya sp.]|uniref:CDP-alcohol phosphatidyltransferase family protein n=1 Tax=Sporichthya sp. TaxID=65475 RepID=UPI0017F2C315|nr:CDP-alcohol phosphatidyltransferase family protein [Sporichthya sp.]MBA3745682.1 CDP-alcohol phosphatidyltransferase family protein [Sporichthya sp.]
MSGDVETGNPDRILTLPNALSLLRLAGVPVFLWLVLGPERDGLALCVLMVAGFTDYADGWLARKLNQTSRLGQMLDPAADRLYILATLIGLTVREIVPLWLTLALIVRDVMLVACVPTLRRLSYGPALPVHYLGKAATFNLLYAFPFLLLGDGTGEMTTVQTLANVLGWSFAIWGSGLYWWAGVLYVVQVRRLVEADRRT